MVAVGAVGMIAFVCSMLFVWFFMVCLVISVVYSLRLLLVARL